MDLIKPTCRESLSDSDRAFLLETLGGTGAGRSAVQNLLQDPASLDLLLDEEALFQALLDLPQALRVSLQFYLYVLLRRILLRSGLDDREITDYLVRTVHEHMPRRGTFLRIRSVSSRSRSLGTCLLVGTKRLREKVSHPFRVSSRFAGFQAHMTRAHAMSGLALQAALHQLCDEFLFMHRSDGASAGLS